MDDGFIFYASGPQLLKRCDARRVVWYADFIVMAIHSLHSNGRPPRGRQSCAVRLAWSSVTHTLRIRNAALQVLAYLCYLLRCSFCLLALCARFQFQLPLATHARTHTHRGQHEHGQENVEVATRAARFCLRPSNTKREREIETGRERAIYINMRGNS